MQTKAESLIQAVQQAKQEAEAAVQASSCQWSERLIRTAALDYHSAMSDFEHAAEKALTLLNLAKREAQPDK